MTTCSARRPAWALLCSIGVAATALATPLASAKPAWTIDDIFEFVTPFAIGHRGSGANLGEDPDRPIENTRESVRMAYRDGVSIVEVDVQITADGVVVAFHDDFLVGPAGITCVNELTYRELRQRLGDVSRLKDVLHTARSYRRHLDGPSGLLIVEMKAPAPVCDPGDVTEFAYVSAVVEAIQESGMEEQVMLESFSPTLLEIARALAPGVERQLAGSILQFLSPEEVEAATGLPVNIIAKDDFGLQWAEIGPLFRLPGYTSMEEFLLVTLAVGSRAVALDALILFQAEQSAPGSGAGLVALMQSFGLPVLTYTLNTEAEWLFAASLGVDGIYTDEVALGLALQGN